MPGMFADQFRVAQPYTPDRLATGNIQVGATLPRKPPTEEKTPTEEPTSGKNPGTEPGAKGIAARSTTGAAAGASSSLSASQRSAMAGLPAAAMSAAMGHGTNAATTGIPSPEWGIASAPAPDIFHKPTTGATVPGKTPATYSGIYNRPGVTSVPSSTPASTGGGIGHWIAHTYDSARHGVAAGADAANNFMTSPTVQGIANFGNPIPPGQPGNSGPVFVTQQRLREQAAQRAAAQRASVPGVQPDLWNVPAKSPGVGSSQAASAVERGPYVNVPQQVNAQQFSGAGNESAAPSVTDSSPSWISDVESFLKNVAEAGAEAA